MHANAGLPGERARAPIRDEMGGAAACTAPAGSRSDKNLRHAISIEKRTSLQYSRDRRRRPGLESGWRGFLSLRDPTALAGRSGHRYLLRPPPSD